MDSTLKRCTDSFRFRTSDLGALRCDVTTAGGFLFRI